MGQRAVGSLLLGLLLLHARLLAVSVRDRGRGGARQLGGDTGGCSAGTLARDGRACEGPWAGTGQRHPTAWGFPRGRPRDPVWRSGGRSCKCGNRRVAGHVVQAQSRLWAWPGLQFWRVGGLTEKLLAGWELGRTRVLLSAANLAEGALHGDGYPVSLRWNFTMLSSGGRL